MPKKIITDVKNAVTISKFRIIKENPVIKKISKIFKYFLNLSVILLIPPKFQYLKYLLYSNKKTFNNQIFLKFISVIIKIYTYYNKNLYLSDELTLNDSNDRIK